MAPTTLKSTFRRRTQAPKPSSLSSSATTKTQGGNGDYIDACCEECASGEVPEELLLCDKCDRGFHLFCLRPILACVPKGLWFCPSCSNQKKPKRFPLIQTKIVDFFRIQRSPNYPQKPFCDARKKRKRSGSIVVSKKKRKLLAFNPTEDPERRLEQMASLATALTDTGTEFSNELTYMPGMAPRSANLAFQEREGMQVLSREDTETLNTCKSMMERGEWPPLLVVFDPCEGFTVQADRFIKDLTIITEYTGDVDYLKNREEDDGDSMMTLLSAKHPSHSLVICPDKRGNIARFINGINNHTPDGKKKQNLKCVRFNVNGECRVLLIAIRDISKGERLYYDYNGYEKEYPTQHFV
ncbi:histone-lysine N-methyltransferase ATXR6 [Cinnamomum micranthum f. kanehirae]|uniref:[histone H3]-lysine(27) N-methyltransferase n=1 Tax=Cinnamomum micranthum f. kanehirae TaxID=337451 RepID=A0A3S3NKD4_9MAGN|nr:histone-lysine N-methyltransferase ATXR6 [Cinnamomum micranthum f. kanehirae]